jgi:hypothetical protein
MHIGEVEAGKDCTCGYREIYGHDRFSGLRLDRPAIEARHAPGGPGVTPPRAATKLRNPA